MIIVNSKSTALVREHHLACRIDSLNAQRIVAAAEYFSAIIKKQNVLKKKILIATLEEDQESINYHYAQHDYLDRCHSDITMRVLQEEIEELESQRVIT